METLLGIYKSGTVSDIDCNLLIPEQSTPASGPGEFSGCGCDTFEFGCCPDGVTAAAGPALEGCPDCNSEEGCCPDGLTPKSGMSVQ